MGQDRNSFVFDKILDLYRMPQSLLQGLPYGLKQSRIRGLDIPKISTKKIPSNQFILFSHRKNENKYYNDISKFTWLNSRTTNTWPRWIGIFETCSIRNVLRPWRIVVPLKGLRSMRCCYTNLRPRKINNFDIKLI